MSVTEGIPNLSLKVLRDDDVLFAGKHDGAPIQSIHGVPAKIGCTKKTRLKKMRTGSTDWSLWLKPRLASEKRKAIMCKTIP